jgi:hypothetical protein
MLRHTSFWIAYGSITYRLQMVVRRAKRVAVRVTETADELSTVRATVLIWIVVRTFVRATETVFTVQ